MGLRLLLLRRRRRRMGRGVRRVREGGVKVGNRDRVGSRRDSRGEVVVVVKRKSRVGRVGIDEDRSDKSNINRGILVDDCYSCLLAGIICIVYGYSVCLMRW